MKLKGEGLSTKSKKNATSIVLYVAAIVVALVGIAYLVINVIMFNQGVAQYVAQGYPAEVVLAQLVPSQLLPGIFQPVAVYGGIALVLFGAGKINNKVSKCLAALTEVEAEAEDAAGDSGETEQAEIAAESSDADGSK